MSRDFLTHKLKQQNQNRGPSTQVINLFQLPSYRAVTKTKNVPVSPCHFLISTYFHFMNFLFLRKCQIVHVCVCPCLDSELQGCPLFLYALQLLKYSVPSDFFSRTVLFLTLCTSQIQHGSLNNYPGFDWVVDDKISFRSFQVMFLYKTVN